MNSLRILTTGGFISFRALFNWLHPSIYIPTMLGKPLFQLIFFTYLGRLSTIGDDTYFAVGNAIQASAVAGLYGMVMSVANEREFGTLGTILATPANRLPLFLGRAIPVIGHGLVVSSFSLGAGFVLLDLRMPLEAVPAVAATLVVAAASATMFGLAVGSIGVRVRDLWVWLQPRLLPAPPTLRDDRAVVRPAWVAGDGRTGLATHPRHSGGT